MFIFHGIFKPIYYTMSAKGSVLKRVRQSKKANARNKHYKSKLNTTVKNFLSSNKKEAEKKFPEVIKLVDQIASKGVIHKNKANNKKSKLANYLNKK
tara:strand:+ start:839 stop:1129 length:291 start_codon:yes stop_codon:yes gene_type:complete